MKVKLLVFLLAVLFALPAFADKHVEFTCDAKGRVTGWSAWYDTQADVDLDRSFDGMFAMFWYPLPSPFRVTETLSGQSAPRPWGIREFEFEHWASVVVATVTILPKDENESSK
jgi:hypothetical protein